MFTGLIEETGIIKSVKQGRNSAVLSITAKKVFDDLKTGDSISTNGVCLTVTSLSGNTFSVDVMAETLDSTNLGNLTSGDKVNLERAMKAGDRFGGHIVSGHIDGTGVIKEFRKEDIATMVEIAAGSELLKYIIHKGSVAIDGISLTVAATDKKSFTVGIIPHTSAETTLLQKKIGKKVNIECDMIGKYIEKFVNAPEIKDRKSNINESFLKENGFF